MAKTLDPVQAARRAAIQRESKRNKERKQQAQQARELRQDTAPLERQIRRLESRQNTLSEDDQEELQRLQREVADVKRIKEEYVRNHPDQRNFVRGYEEKASTDSKPGELSNAPQQTATATARDSQNAPSRDPRWSIYYDPVFNPYGAPPPGMPYLDKPHSQLVAEGLLDVAKPPPLPEETADFEDGDSDEDSDDSSIDDDLKDIVMPAGPPPIKLASHQGEIRPSPATADRGRAVRGTGKARGRPPGSEQHRGGRHGPGNGIGRGMARPIHSAAGLPARPPPGLPQRPLVPVAAATGSRPQAAAPASGTPKPPGPPPAVPDGVVISAEPQLRDLRKETTAFVPAAIRKKQQEEKARMKRGLPGRIDAAPLSENMTGPADAAQKERPDLLKSVQAHLPSKAAEASGGQQSSEGGSSAQDYDRFLREVGDLL
ncbi:uncharacterized protein PSANT_03281 [Moesziomyces antarcticus]|nr:uncharacterized protein PSANT_03281 [Moesziomyces antarcticus]